jgi:5'-nucleotidase
MILVSNDDSINAAGLYASIEMLAPLGDLLVVAPDVPRSGASHALTVNDPVKLRKVKETEALSIYTCSGTPADCVKIAMGTLLKRPPDLMVAGINHGSNSSVSVIYSGTMGAAIEAAMSGVPAIGVSLCNHSPDADFSASIKYGRIIVEKVLKAGLPEKISLNVNVPDLPSEQIRGIKICRQNRGNWIEKFEQWHDSLTGEDLYSLTGFYRNEEPDAEDTDETALENGYVSIVPIQVDMTAYGVIDTLKNNLEIY